MNHVEVSEIVAGKILTEEFDPRSVNPDWFYPPYNDLVRMKQNGAIKQELFSRSPEHFQSAIESTRYVNGALSLKEYLELLHDTYQLALVAEELDILSKQFRRGDNRNLAKLSTLGRDAQKGLVERITPLSEIEPGDEYISCGVPAIDKWLGGIPEVGMTLIGAETGIGKTTFALGFAFHFLKTYLEKHCLFFTLEMTKPQIKKRAEQIFLDNEVYQRIHAVEDFIKSKEVLPFGSTIENLGLIVIDFVNLITENEEPQAMALVYRDLMFATKELRIPMLVLTQLTMDGGGIPRTRNARMTKMAGNLAVQGWTLYSPYSDRDYKKEDPILPRRETRTAKAGYLVSDKARFGVPMETIRSGYPGAIQFPVRPGRGWDLTSPGSWYSLIRS